MNLTKKLIAILMVFAMIFAFAACGETDEEEMLDIGTVNIGIVLSGDPNQDGSLSKLHLDSFKAAYGGAGAGDSQVTEETKVDPADEKAVDKAIVDLIERGCRVIFGADERYYDAFVKYAKEYESTTPEIYFLALTGYNQKTTDVKNLASFYLRNYEGEYLEGVIAASTSKTGKIGYVLDTSYAPENKVDVNAFLLGAKSVNPAASVALYAGEGSEAGFDKAVNEKCDVIYSRNFVKEGEEEAFLTVPGSAANSMSVNISDGDAAFVSASVLDLDSLYSKLLIETINENFDAIKGYSAGLKEGAVDVSPVKDAALKAKIDALKSQEVLSAIDMTTLSAKYDPSIIVK